ncbi:uncharacterized protein VNE69_03226 [Vairimorpha necatrix]|uniref:Uncharacterized protein n=1 Tax=Vairimorpha necatrix TaxID=6039 RepID=A0AAX4JAK8_9MICR
MHNQKTKESFKFHEIQNFLAENVKINDHNFRFDKFIDVQMQDLKIEKINFDNLEDLKNIKDINQFQTFLSEIFYKNTDIKISEKILKIILNSLKFHKFDPSKFLKGISKHMKNPLHEIYEHALILTASLFEDSNFNFSNFRSFEKFKSFMPQECFKEKKLIKLKSKFDDKLKISNNIKIYKDKINYLQEGIQIIKDENKKRLEEVFNKLPFLIENSTSRILREKSLEYFHIILNYDGFDLLKSEALFSLVEQNSKFEKQNFKFEKQNSKFERQNSTIERHNFKFERQNSKFERQNYKFERHNFKFETLSNLDREMINLLFGNKICLRFKVCITDVIIKIIERSENLERIRNLILELSEEINKTEKKMNEIILNNLAYIFEISKFKS